MAEVLEKYKKIIKNEFFPARGFGKVRLSIARKAVNDFKKITNSKTELADIMLFYVENGVEYTNDYGDIDEAFYSSMESVYESALSHISKSNLEDEFYECCDCVVSATSGIGWGFHDGLCDIFYTYLETK